MFGIKKKVYYILALVSSIIGIVILALKVFKVLPDDNLYTLIALVFLLLAFVFYLRPMFKLLKTIQAINMKYRGDLYTIITKDCPSDKIDISELTFLENEEHKLMFVTKNNKEQLVFDALTFEEGLVIMLSLISDFIMIVYGVSENKKKISKANIADFVVNVKKANGDVLKYQLIKDYQYLDKSHRLLR